MLPKVLLSFVYAIDFYLFIELGTLGDKYHLLAWGKTVFQAILER